MRRNIVFVGGKRWERARGALFEARRRVVGRAACPDCGKLRSLVAETATWKRGNRTGSRWLHAGFRPGVARCRPCGVFFGPDDGGGTPFASRKPQQLVFTTTVEA